VPAHTETAYGVVLSRGLPLDDDARLLTLDDDRARIRIEQLLTGEIKRHPARTDFLDRVANGAVSALDLAAEHHHVAVVADP
jgi:hypothetical protein